MKSFAEALTWLDAQWKIMRHMTPEQVKEYIKKPTIIERLEAEKQTEE